MRTQERTIVCFALMLMIFGSFCYSIAGDEVERTQLLSSIKDRCTDEEFRLVKKLYSSKSMDRGDALDALREHQQIVSLVLPRVVSLLSDSNVWDPFSRATVGEEAASLLKCVGGNVVFSIAETAATNCNVIARRNSVWIFPSKFGRAETNAVPVLTRMTLDDDSIVRNRAARKLSGMDMTKFNNNRDLWLHWFENSAWNSPRFQDYSFFAIFEDSRIRGPSVSAPLDITKIPSFTNSYYHVTWTKDDFGRIQEVEKIEKGKIVWKKHYAPGESNSIREQLFIH